ncbi:MAG TPA: (Fe-S)-binding protein [Acidimicrobiales bacterium]|nr:(Fe-S)-binding protein [Acidimicrobiales bacterium]
MPVDRSVTKVALFPTCVVDAVAPEVGFATARVLARRGCEVEVAERTTCCGQPAWNSGHAEPAAVVARTTLAGIEEALADGAEAVVVPAGSCTTMIRVFWPELFAEVGQHDAARRARAVAPKVFELSEYLASAKDDRPIGAEILHRSEGAAVRYHPSCHMLRELGIRDQPCAALEGAGYDVGRGPERCCGFGGLFSVKLPETSVAMADEVLDAAVAAGASDIVAADGSCLMQLATRAEARGLPLRFRHLAVALDDAEAEAEI